VERAARYTMTPLGALVKMAAPPAGALEPLAARTVYALARGACADTTPQQRKVLEAGADGAPRSAAELARAAGVSAGVVRTLCKRGLLRAVEVARPAPCSAPDLDPARGAALTPAQRAAADALAGHIAPLSSLLPAVADAPAGPSPRLSGAPPANGPHGAGSAMSARPPWNEDGGGGPGAGPLRGPGGPKSLKRQEAKTPSGGVHPPLPPPCPRGGGLESGGFQAFVLDGVTGSGKTEVYFEAVAAALQAGGQALILLPEIALTAAFTDRFARRFGCAPALWHSALTPAQRAATWRGAASGATRVVAGARSALFLPFADLALIVVDEAHEAAYKQEEGAALYHARDMAVLRAQCEGAPIVLASATPALETVERVWAGRYTRLELPDRYGGARLPSVEVVDLRAHPPEAGDFLAPPLRHAVDGALKAGEQALLFLNRRGYAPLTLCRACGHRLECPNCTAWMVAHRGAGALLCHHCGHRAAAPPEVCPSCGEDPAVWAECGPGVERVAQEAARAFPGARCLTLASDTTGGPAALRAALGAVERREVDIVIGTQIVAKGHHFPGLTVVGVVDADLGLAGAELRAAERTYQLLHQVAGRAGRAAGAPGRVLLQSWAPESAVLRALVAGDRDAFYRAEAAERRAAGMPPYARLVAVIVSGQDAQAVEGAAKALGAAAPQVGGVEVYGPAPAPMERLRACRPWWPGGSRGCGCPAGCRCRWT